MTTTLRPADRTTWHTLSAVSLGLVVRRERELAGSSAVFAYLSPAHVRLSPGAAPPAARDLRAQQ